MSDFRAWETRNLIKFAQEANTRIQELEADLKTAIHAYRHFMKPSHAPKLRELLRQSPDGMTTALLHDATGIRADTIGNTLASMPDAYIDRWTWPYRGQWAAVWCVVVPPENCPRPTDA